MEKHLLFIKSALKIVQDIYKGTSANSFRLESVVPVPEPQNGYEIGISFKTVDSGELGALFANNEQRETKYVTLDAERNFISLRSENIG